MAPLRDYAIIFFGIATTIGFGVMFWRMSVIAKKIRRLMGGDAKTPPSEAILRRIARIEAMIEELDPRLMRAEHAAQTSIRKIGFSRFNPFQDTGGDNSFTLALLDQDNNGVLLSSLYMRDGVRLYGKSIQRGLSKHNLSEEEKNLLDETLRKS